MSRKPFKSVGGIKTTRKPQIIRSDVCGPMSVQSFTGKLYFVTFIEDYSRCVKVYFIRKKSEVLAKLKEFEVAATNEAGYKIGTLRTDNGGEYTSRELEDYLKKKGIKHETSVSHSPQQNGVAEHMNRTLLESARAMVYHAGLSKKFWAEAINTAAFIRNRVVTATTGQSPYERWYGKVPDVSQFRVFGCIAYAHIPEAERRKLGMKVNKLRFLGYSDTQKGYRLFDVRNNKVIVKRDVIFNEADFGHQKESVEMDIGKEVYAQNKLVDEGTSNTSDNVFSKDEQVLPRRSQRTTKGVPPARFGLDENIGASEATHVAFHAGIEEPATIEEAFNSEYSKEWKEATDSEYQSLLENETWDLVDLPENRKAIDCKWVFKVKYDENGQVDRFKGRLVAKGYSQQYKINYEETFSPVVRFSSIRTLLAFAVEKEMIIHQMDVKTAFLNGELEEEIYMEQPEGYQVPGKEDKVCRLKKSLYGLKQSPRCWNRAFTEEMKKQNFRQSQADTCIFIKEGSQASNIKEITIIAVYVDDLIIITPNQNEMDEIKGHLSKAFKMKDMGSLHYCLGVNIEQTKDGLRLSQKQYIMKVIERYGLQDANPVSTPMDLNVKHVADDGYSKAEDKTQYQSVIGSLLYAAIATRPDISHAVDLSKFNSAPTEAHLTAAKRIIRYLKGTINTSIQYRKTGNLEVIGYSDADWANDMEHRHYDWQCIHNGRWTN